MAGGRPGRKRSVAAARAARGQTGDLCRQEIRRCSESVAAALRDSLKSLFSEPSLPDNPFHYLARILGAYVDANALWALPDDALLACLDEQGGGLEVADAGSKLCRLSAAATVFGLPHVLRCASKDGVRLVQELLLNGAFPDSFFPPEATPFSSCDGYTVQVLASLQGASALWHPQWLEFPELVVRCDVVVRGPRLEAALAQLAELLCDELAELEGVPVYFVEGLRFSEQPGAAGQQQGAPAAAAREELWRPADVAARPDAFRAALSRNVLAGRRLELAAVVLLDAPADERMQTRALRFEMVSKRYVFHFIPTPDAASTSSSSAPPPPPPPQPGRKGKHAAAAPPSVPARAAKGAVHYGCRAYDALLEGLFLDRGAAKQYLQLFGAPPQPYGSNALAANTQQLRALVEADLARGASLEAFRRLLLLVLLQDPVLADAGPLSPPQLLTLEELLLALPPGTSEAGMLLSTVPSLLRMTNTGAAVISGIVRELQAVQLVTELWPSRKESIAAQALAASMHGGDAGASSSSSSSTGATGDDGAGPSAILAWLSQFNMESKVLQQLLSLRPRMLAAAGGSTFSGVSLVLAQLLEQLPRQVPGSAVECCEALQGARGTMQSVQQLLQGAGLTLADALLDRCRDVAWALQHLGIQLCDSAAARSASGADDSELPVQWVLQVGAVTEAQVRAGAVAERVATEGVMLQYAVDTQLDLLLGRVYALLTTPPLPRNPWPRVLHLLRAHAARMELWKEDAEDAVARMTNQLALLSASSFIYAATPPDAAAGRGWRGGGRARQGRAADDDDDGAAVYGCYAAVTLCDCRALQALAASLGALASERQVQQGGYSCEVLPALAGDAWLSGVLGLDPQEEAAGGARQQAGASASGCCLYESERFYAVHLEEHHQLSGPSIQKAAALFAAGVADHVLGLHHHSQHIVHQVTAGAETFKLQQLLTPDGKQALVSCLVAAVQAAVQAAPATWSDVCIAQLHLLVAVREGIYVSLAKRVHFNWRRDGLPHDTHSTAAAVHWRGSAPQPGFVLPAGEEGSGSAGSAAADGSAASTGAACPDPLWGLGIYQRVFLSEAAAAAWHSWNSARGDPAQPCHMEHMAQQAQQQAARLQAAGNQLDAQKLLLAVGAATLDNAAVFHASRVLQSAAQELRVLQDVSAALQVLLSPELSPAARAKLDSERVRRLFLRWAGRLRRALASPGACHFSGLAAACPALIGQLQGVVLGAGGGELSGGSAAAMRQLDLAARACELSVAAAAAECAGG